MPEPVVVAASISAVGVAVAGVVAWLMNLSVRERTKVHDVELTNLRAQISESEARLLGETQRAQASHEAQLRERLEFRLKLYGLAAESVASASAAISGAFESLIQSGRAAQSGGQTGPFDERLVALLTAGIMLPPALDEPYKAAIVEFGNLHRDLLQAFQDSPADAKSNYMNMIANRLGRTMGAFRTAAETWKAGIWAEGKQPNA